MNARKAKAIRKAVLLPHVELERKYTSTTIPLLEGGSCLVPIPLTAKYPEGSFRRVYQHVKRIVKEAASHSDFTVQKAFRNISLDQIVKAVI